MFGKAAKNGKLLIAGVACCVDPTGLSIAAAAADGVIHASDEWFRSKPDLAKLAAELDAAFEAEIKKPGYNKPDGIRTLLPQMLEASFPTGSTFTECDLDTGLIIERMKANLTDPEHCKPENLDRFEQAVRPLLTKLCNDQRLIDVLNPALMRRQMKHTSEIRKLLEQVRQGQADQISLEDMIRLAARFGEHTITNQTALTEFLTKKAEEYTAHKAAAEAIPEHFKRLTNLKAAAQDAIARVDLDEVENLMSMVHEAELEEAAKSAEIRANNALLRGNTKHAYVLLSGAANSFDAVDTLEPARRIILLYAKILGDHGLRYGGDGLDTSAQLVRSILTDELRKKDASLWAAGQNNLAIALQNKGIRSANSAGTELLTQAVEAFHKALEVYTSANHPLDWAMANNNLGTALHDQSLNLEGVEGAKLHLQAVDAYRNALQVRTRVDHPSDWAITQNNLGNALQERGSRTEGETGRELLAQAVMAYEKALQVTNCEDNPEQWATLQNNLGVALEKLGNRTFGIAGADLLSKAVVCFLNALKVRKRNSHPVAWSATQNNLGNTYRSQASLSKGIECTTLLARAITAYNKVLKTCNRTDHRVNWAMTQENIAIAERYMARQLNYADSRAALVRGLDAVEQALRVFDPENMHFQHTKATRLREDILADLAALD